MKRFLQKLRARFERRAARSRPARERQGAACGYEAAWPALEPIAVPAREKVRHETRHETRRETR